MKEENILEKVKEGLNNRKNRLTAAKECVHILYTDVEFSVNDIDNKWEIIDELDKIINETDKSLNTVANEIKTAAEFGKEFDHEHN